MQAVLWYRDFLSLSQMRMRLERELRSEEISLGKMPKQTLPHWCGKGIGSFPRGFRRVPWGNGRGESRTWYTSSGRLWGSPVQTTQGRCGLPSSLEGQRKCSSESRWQGPGKARAILAQGRSGSDTGAARPLWRSNGSCDGRKPHQSLAMGKGLGPEMTGETGEMVTGWWQPRQLAHLKVTLLYSPEGTARGSLAWPHPGPSHHHLSPGWHRSLPSHPFPPQCCSV